MKKLDNLFQQKLINHAVQPSDTAWEKIHEELQPRKGKRWFLYLSVAASIVLVFSLSILLYLNQPTSIINVVTDNQQDLPKEVLEEKLSQTKLLDQPMAEIPENPQKSDKNEAGKKAHVPEKNHEIQNKDIILDQNENLEPLLAVQELQMEEADLVTDLKENMPELVASAEKPQPVIRITYKRSETVRSEPLHLEEKDRTLEKMIVFAQDIKNSGFGLSDLRQAKDQLLDIDFRRSETKFRNN